MLTFWAMANPIFVDLLELPDLFLEWNAWPNRMPTLTSLNVRMRQIQHFLDRQLETMLQLPTGHQSRLNEKLSRLQAKLYLTQQKVFACHLTGMAFHEVVEATIGAFESPSDPPAAYATFAMAKEFAENNFGNNKVHNADMARDLELGCCTRASRREIIKAAVQKSMDYPRTKSREKEAFIDSFVTEESDPRWTNAIAVYNNPENDLLKCIEMIESVRKRLAKPSQSSCVIL